MRDRFLLFSILGIALISSDLLAQDQGGEIAKATSFSIPSSPAFNLLDVNPTTVNKPGFARDFKLDWVTTGNTLKPNIAIEAQPIWLFFYDKTSRDNYKKKSGAARALSTLNLSLGTVARDTLRSLAYSAKFTLYKQYDPVLDDGFIDDLNITLTAREKELEQQKALKSALLSMTTDDAKKAQLENEIKALDLELAGLTETESKRIKSVKEKYAKDHWNDAFFDIGAGQILNYREKRFDSLDLKNKGVGIWMNGNVGIGKNAMISFLAKYVNVDDDVLFLGSNFRYGSPKVNFFAEFTAQIQDKNTYIIAYGGEYRASEKLLIEFGLRTNYDKDFNFFRLQPSVNLNYRLAKTD